MTLEEFKHSKAKVRAFQRGFREFLKNNLESLLENLSREKFHKYFQVLKLNNKNSSNHKWDVFETTDGLFIGINEKENLKGISKADVDAQFNSWNYEFCADMKYAPLKTACVYFYQIRDMVFATPVQYFVNLISYNEDLLDSIDIQNDLGLDLNDYIDWTVEGEMFASEHWFRFTCIREKMYECLTNIPENINAYIFAQIKCRTEARKAWQKSIDDMSLDQAYIDSLPASPYDDDFSD